ncbi:hypothetical protein I204_01943 [Kwoniella mangroviensis CBS 8886]|uniref:uncharacterized protein n=1 Tax=Kwoniella mangroviensis CBS 8507 TaxID=1296122 RepID=UPI00080D5AAD|nr:uncharacterized protein I203_03750 [Kwoniella mangroviensis CBS 8507]OCF67066.1 hypothetical protein I203_03750 [Kwoniella mangroviensis CBS 8507]OCF77939.1 hypothetical protein I204_01943 [Kwoniella mangroviensis CBS 8886]
MPSITSDSDLEKHYRSYIDAINTITSLPSSVLNPYLGENNINHNDRGLSSEQYHQLIIPKSVFKIEDVVASVEDKRVASRLEIVLGDGTGRVVKEHVFYLYDEDWRIVRVWSMVEGL